MRYRAALNSMIIRTVFLFTVSLRQTIRHGLLNFEIWVCVISTSFEATNVITDIDVIAKKGLEFLLKTMT